VRLATQGKILAEARIRKQQLRQANENAERAARELREEIAATNGGKSPVVEKLRSEKAAVEEQLRVARDERAKLQRDINAIQQQAESSWQTERMENALLRERINDIAAEVAKLAMQLEGPNSAIEAMLACGTAENPGQARQRRHLEPPPSRKAAGHWPNASARCSRTPRAPASRGVIPRSREIATLRPTDRLTLGARTS
jgi:chromosome segregation ATPase